MKLALVTIVLFLAVLVIGFPFGVGLSVSGRALFGAALGGLALPICFEVARWALR